jgi:hypothetical protein
MAQSEIDRELKKAIDNLKLLRKGLTRKEIQDPLKKSSKILVKASKQNIPKGKRQFHHRYEGKVSGKKKAPKGLGKIAATYYKGNLRRSLQTLIFRRSLNVFVGFKRPKGGNRGEFKGRKVDGYYAIMRMELGQAPLRRAVDSTKTQMGTDITQRLNELAKQVLGKLK